MSSTYSRSRHSQSRRRLQARSSCRALHGARIQSHRQNTSALVSRLLACLLACVFGPPLVFKVGCWHKLDRIMEGNKIFLKGKREEEYATMGKKTHEEKSPSLGNPARLTTLLGFPRTFAGLCFSFLATFESSNHCLDAGACIEERVGLSREGLTLQGH